MSRGPTRLVSPETLGAWVVKCDPRANPDVAGAVRSGEPWVAERWCVVDNYRSRMMVDGDRAVLWVSGDGRTMARGVWGLGRVTGPARGMVGDAPGGTPRLEVPLHLPLLRTAVSPAEIRAAGVADLEVLVQPHGSNPSWMSKDQLSALSEVLGEWPGPVAWSD